MTLKKPYAAFLLICFFMPFLFAGCSSKNREPSPYTEVNTIDGIWMEIKEETVSPTGLDFVFQNTSGRDDFFYGEFFRLEEYKRGNWFMVDPLPDVEWYHLLWARYICSPEKMEQLLSIGTGIWRGYALNEMGYVWD